MRTLQPVVDRLAGEPLLQRAIRRGEQRPGMAGGELAVGEQMLDRGRQSEQTQCVGDRRATLADAIGDLLVRQSEVVDQLLEGGRLLERREVLAMEVLDQRLLDDGQVVGAAYERRDRRQPGAPGGTPPALAGDQLVAGPRLDRADQDRLQDADLLDAGGELGQRLLVEVDARLMRVGRDVGDRDVDQDRGVIAASRRSLHRAG